MPHRWTWLWPYLVFDVRNVWRDPCGNREKKRDNLSFGIVTINDFMCIHLYKPAFPSSRHTVTSVCQHVRYLLPSSRKRVRATSCGYAMNVAIDLDTAPANINSKKSLIDRPSFGCVCLISACRAEKQEDNAPSFVTDSFFDELQNARGTYNFLFDCFINNKMNNCFGDANIAGGDAFVETKNARCSIDASHASPCSQSMPCVLIELQPCLDHPYRTSGRRWHKTSTQCTEYVYNMWIGWNSVSNRKAMREMKFARPEVDVLRDWEWTYCVWLSDFFVFV